MPTLYLIIVEWLLGSVCQNSTLVTKSWLVEHLGFLLRCERFANGSSKDEVYIFILSYHQLFGLVWEASQGHHPARSLCNSLHTLRISAGDSWLQHETWPAYQSGLGIWIVHASCLVYHKLYVWTINVTCTRLPYVCTSIVTRMSTSSSNITFADPTFWAPVMSPCTPTTSQHLHTFPGSCQVTHNG